jgi:class 3 adenylate cyclase
VADPIEVKRRLAAIFAADVEGYSRLMGADEVATMDALTARREILDGLIATHGGRIANTAGDSVLAEFGSAVDAVRCAMEAQVALATANSTLPESRRVNFRMGVHVGDVMVRAGDLFGDGVNIAAREILRGLTPDLLAARLAVEPGIMAGTVHGPVTRAVIEGETLVRADGREADNIAFGTYPAWHLLAEFQDHARSVCDG